MNAEVIARFLDSRDSLSLSELEGLAEWLRATPEATDRLFALLTVDDLLGRAISPDRSGFEEQIRQRLDDLKRQTGQDRFESEVLHRVADEKRRLRRRLLFPALAVAAGMLVLFGLWLRMPARNTGTVLATVAAVQGEVQLVSDAGRSVKVLPGMSVTFGEWVETGQRALAELRMTRGETIAVDSNTRLGAGLEEGLTGKEGFYLASGRISVAVPEPRRDDALLFATPHALARITGTTFGLEAQTPVSRLDVTEGMVAWTPRGQDRTFNVGAGQSAAAGASGHAALLGRPVWTEDFSRGLDAWQVFGEADGGVYSFPEDELVLRARIVASGRRGGGDEKALELDARGVRGGYVNVSLKLPLTNRVFAVFFDYNVTDVRGGGGLDVICLSPLGSKLETLFRGGPELTLRRWTSARYESSLVVNDQGGSELYDRRFYVGDALAFWGKRTFSNPVKARYLRFSARDARLRLKNIRIVPLLETTVPLDGKASLVTGN